MMHRLLLCTDLDRTLIANGVAEECAGARERFDALVARPEIILAYVTGRHLGLVQQAIREFHLPDPDYIIADVGTSIYCRHEKASWRIHADWQSEIGSDWNGQRAADLEAQLRNLPGLKLQEADRQGEFKLSYYFSASQSNESLVKSVSQLLSAASIRARVICSIDETRDIGLLDIIPERASKLHAIEALMRDLDLSANEVMFSGDSGNDLEVLASHIPSVLVANASHEIKSLAKQRAQAAGHANTLYIAVGGFMGMNGCYSAGILEGMAHFHPGTLDWMHASQPSSTRP